MIIPLPDARELSDEVLEPLRLRALRGCQLGLTEAQVAQILGVARETVCRWWSAFADRGVQALPRRRTGRPLGSGRVLTDSRADRIQHLLRIHQPEELGIESPLWIRRAVVDLITREFGLVLAVRTVGRYLARWGFTAKRPRRHSCDQDPGEVEEWLERTCPAIEERAEREGAVIYWGDKTGVAADDRRARPAHPRQPDLGGQQHGRGPLHDLSRTMNAALFLVFLERLLRSTTGKVLLIVDRLRAHMTPEVQEWVTSRRERIEVFYLPRYSPEVNPDEYLNNDLKGQVNKAGLPHDTTEVRSRIQKFMRRLLHLPEHAMQYLCHPSSQYAMAIN